MGLFVGTWLCVLAFGGLLLSSIIIGRYLFSVMNLPAWTAHDPVHFLSGASILLIFAWVLKILFKGEANNANGHGAPAIYPMLKRMPREVGFSLIVRVLFCCVLLGLLYDVLCTGDVEIIKFDRVLTALAQGGVLFGVVVLLFTGKFRGGSYRGGYYSLLLESCFM